MTRLLIVQSYIPSYRVPFFQGLKESLGSGGVQALVAGGGATGDMGLRGDDATERVADVYLSAHTMQLLGRSVVSHDVGSVMDRIRPDMVILEQALKSLDAMQSLVTPRRFRRASIGLWGQGRAFSRPQGSVASALKTRLTNRADWFFAYTDEGAQHVVEHGFPQDRVTCVRNTIDTAALVSDLNRVDGHMVDEFKARYGLTPGRTGLFLGGVDEDKGMDFLVDTVRFITRKMPEFRLLIGGVGAGTQQIQQLEATGVPVIYLGRLDGSEKALALSACDVLMIPQWVGLVAVDSLVAGRPIVTTEHRSHSPEFGYLTPERNCAVAAHSVVPYATAVLDLLGDTARLTRMQERARRDASAYQLETMITNFSQGVLAWDAWRQHGA